MPNPDSDFQTRGLCAAQRGGRLRPVAFRLGRLLPAVVLAVFTALLLTPPSPATIGLDDFVYRGQQEIRRFLLVRAFGASGRLESRHFVLYYDAAVDSAWAGPVLEAAETARGTAIRLLDLAPLARSGAKVPLLLYPDETSINQQFASGPQGFRALGAYWCGVLQVLSPRLWLGLDPSDAPAQVLRTAGPLVHEYVHYLLDSRVPAGICPRWLSEGLAQYVEYRDTGYLWLEAGNALETPVDPLSVYGVERLEGDFDSLTNVALAYRQAFLLVAFLQEERPPSLMGGILADMSSGRSFWSALRARTGLSVSDFEASWLEWLDQNLARYS